MIGRLNIIRDPTWITPDIIKNTLTSSNFKVIDLNDTLAGICALPNDNLILGNYHKSDLDLYDKKFNLIKNVEYVDNIPFRPHDMATDNFDKVYIGDASNETVLMTNIEINKLICSFDSQAAGFSQPLAPICISYHKEYIYAGDYNHSCIAKLSSDLDLVDIFYTHYSPLELKAANGTLCVVGGNTSKFYFYDIETCELKNKYCYDYHTLSVVNSLFCMFAHKPDYLLDVYDTNGELIKSFSLNLNNLEDYLSELNNFKISYFNDCLILSCDKQIMFLFDIADQ